MFHNHIGTKKFKHTGLALTILARGFRMNLIV